MKSDCIDKLVTYRDGNIFIFKVNKNKYWNFGSVYNRSNKTVWLVTIIFVVIIAHIYKTSMLCLYNVQCFCLNCLNLLKVLLQFISLNFDFAFAQKSNENNNCIMTIVLIISIETQSSWRHIQIPFCDF